MASNPRDTYSPLDYQADDDQEVYRQSSVVIPAYGTVKLAACTVAGGPARRNEDAFAVTVDETGLWAAVFDGISSLYPIPSLVEQGLSGARFASHCLHAAFTHAPKNVSPAELMCWLNRAFADQLAVLGLDKIAHSVRPSATATIVHLDPRRDRLELAHVGDSFCLLYDQSGASQLVTSNRNAPFDAHVLALIATIAVERGITPREARQDPRVTERLAAIRQVRDNNPDGTGCGLLNGDDHVRAYIEETSAPLHAITAVVLGTDGLLPQGWTLEQAADRARLLSIAADGGLTRLVAVKRGSEDADPDGWNLRYKHSDDATGVIIHLP